MGNRSLRRKGALNMLRVVFRDDDLFNKVSGLPKPLIQKTISEPLQNPLYVGSKFLYIFENFMLRYF